jgi:hypothetical protein
VIPARVLEYSYAILNKNNTVHEAKASKANGIRIDNMECLHGFASRIFGSALLRFPRFFF